MAQIQDERFNALFPTIKSGQEAYYKQHGKAYQGVISHSEAQIPEDGAEATADRLDEKPTDQPMTWAEALPAFGLDIGPEWTQAIRVDTWRTTEAVGYTVTRVWVESGERIEKEHTVTLETFTEPQPQTDPYTTRWAKAPSRADFEQDMLAQGLAEEVEVDGETVTRLAPGVHWIGEFWATKPTWDEESQSMTGGTKDGRLVAALRLKDSDLLDQLTVGTTLNAGTEIIDKPSGHLPIVE